MIINTIDKVLTAIGTPAYHAGVMACKAADMTGEIVSSENIKKHGGNVTIALALSGVGGLLATAKINAAAAPVTRNSSFAELLLPSDGSHKHYSTSNSLTQTEVANVKDAPASQPLSETERESLPYYTAETLPPATNSKAGESVVDLAVRSGPVMNDDDCLHLRGGKLFCTTDAWLSSLKDPRDILSRQNDYVDYLLELEKQKNLPKGMLVVMTLIESKLGENMGKNGCSITGKHCGYHQASPEFAREAGYSPADRFDKKKSANMALKMAYVYLKEDPRYHQGLELTTTSSYLRHQQGVAGWAAIEDAALKGAEVLSDADIKRVRLQTAYNIPAQWGNGYVDEYKSKKTGKTRRKLKSDVTTQEIADLFHYGWTNEMIRLSRIVEDVKKDKLQALYGENWKISLAEIG